MGQFLHNRTDRRLLKQRALESREARTTISFYKYASIADPHAFRDQLYALFQGLGVLGRIYVAQEGINAQISVPNEQFDAFKNALYGISFLDGLRLNTAIEDDGKSFFALIIKVRPKSWRTASKTPISTPRITACTSMRPNSTP